MTAFVRPWPPTLLLALFATLAVSSLYQESPTVDEVGHLTAGYTYVKTGDFRFGRDHPPLMKMLAGAALLLLNLKPVVGSPGWESLDPPRFEKDFMLHNRVPPRRIVFLGRLPIVAMGLIMGIFLFVWARELWGYWPGVFVLFLYAFCPNILAHTRLVTTDAGITCFTLLTVFALWKFFGSGSLVHAALCGLALGFALLSKYSAVVTAALVVVLLLVAACLQLWDRRTGAGIAVGIVAGGAKQFSAFDLLKTVVMKQRFTQNVTKTRWGRGARRLALGT